jgi:hypothetical protein
MAACFNHQVGKFTAAAKVTIRVHPPALQGVTLPPKKPVEVPSTFGFVDNAERLNSRAAMVSPLAGSLCWP